MYSRKGTLRPPTLPEKTAALVNDIHRQQLLRTLGSKPMEEETLALFTAALLSEKPYFAVIDLVGKGLRRVSVHPWCPLHAADDVYYVKSVLSDAAVEASVEKYSKFPRKSRGKTVRILAFPFTETEEGLWQAADIMEHIHSIPEGRSVEFLLFDGKRARRPWEISL